MQYSSVIFQRYYLLTGTPNTVTTINTSDGSSSNYTSGLNGLIFFGPQCSNDSLGGVICSISNTTTAGGPSLLGGTPDSFTGWSILYVAAPITPALATDTHATYARIWGNYH